jgi:hypothetical protein
VYASLDSDGEAVCFFSSLLAEKHHYRNSVFVNTNSEFPHIIYLIFQRKTVIEEEIEMSPQENGNQKK